MDVGPVRDDERVAARGILDAAMLEVDEGALGDGTLLVAREEGRILGALLLAGSEVVAVAVRPKRRGQSVGSALVRAAASRREELHAEFDPDVRPFYESLGFEVECDGGRCRGRYR